MVVGNMWSRKCLPRLVLDLLHCSRGMSFHEQGGSYTAAWRVIVLQGEHSRSAGKKDKNKAQLIRDGVDSIWAGLSLEHVRFARELLCSARLRANCAW